MLHIIISGRLLSKMINQFYLAKYREEKILLTQFLDLYLKIFVKSESNRFIAVEAIERLIQNTPCEWIILSYSSGGRATERELKDVIRDNGKLMKAIAIDYQKNVMASMKWTNDWTKETEVPNREFLFLVKGK